MRLFIDRHDVSGSSAEDTARAHALDLELSGQFDVEFLSYWHDATQDLVFCFARAPEADAVTAAHLAAHGGVPSEIIEVSESEVIRFLGRVHDPVDSSEVTSPLRTICFTDLVGSTGMMDRLGQAEFMTLLTEHDVIVRQALLQHGGREVKHTGDGFMAAFEDHGEALRWALDLKRAFGAHPRLDVRIGMAAGEPVDHEDDLFGAAVNLANRICAAADPEQVLVSDLVHQLSADGQFVFDSGRSQVLKGFSEPLLVYELISGS